MRKQIALSFLAAASLLGAAVATAESGAGEIFGRVVSMEEFKDAEKTVSLFSISNREPANDTERRQDVWSHLILLDEADRRGIRVSAEEQKTQLQRLLSEKKIAYGSLEYFEWVQQSFGEDYKTFEKRVENFLKLKGLLLDLQAPNSKETVEGVIERAKLKEVRREEARRGPNVLFETTQGSFEIALFTDIAPKAVENMTRLAQKGYYDGLVFHRVIKDFMIQGGDPTATGSGGESIWGEPFEDEFSDSVNFSKPGILAMANSGPRTNGSQFFITVAPTPHLQGRHTIFGEVTSGYEVVQKISETPVGAGDRPASEQKILRVVVKEEGKK